MSAKLYTLTNNGDATDYMDMSPWAAGAVEFQAKITSGTPTFVLEGSNDNAGNPLNTDLMTYETYATDVARVMYAPLPNKIRIRKTAGTGVVVVTFGRGMDGRGNAGQIVAVGVKAGGPSNDLFAGG